MSVLRNIKRNNAGKTEQLKEHKKKQCWQNRAIKIEAKHSCWKYRNVTIIINLILKVPENNTTFI